MLSILFSVMIWWLQHPVQHQIQHHIQNQIKSNNLFNSELNMTYPIINESLTSATSHTRIITHELQNLERQKPQNVPPRSNQHYPLVYILKRNISPRKTHQRNLNNIYLLDSVYTFNIRNILQYPESDNINNMPTCTNGKLSPEVHTQRTSSREVPNLWSFSFLYVKHTN